jgi:U6 snRNA-associated Sm-like protein LSm8
LNILFAILIALFKNILIIMSEIVMVVTSDGRIIIGNFVGHDQVQNIILKDAYERIYSEDSDVERVTLGLYLLRGDNLCLVGEFQDDELKDGIRVPFPLPAIHQQQT